MAKIFNQKNRIITLLIITKSYLFEVKIFIRANIETNREYIFDIGILERKIREGNQAPIVFYHLEKRHGLRK